MLEGIEGVLIYMDDIWMYGNNKENHDIVLNKVMNVIKLMYGNNKENHDIVLNKVKNVIKQSGLK